MIKHYCDMPGCEREMTGREYHEVNVTKHDDHGDKPSMVSKQICAHCNESLKEFFTLGVQSSV